MGTLPRRNKSVDARMTPTATGQFSAILSADARRILIILPSWVGDACMATPLLRHLAMTHPHARIVAFGKDHLRSLMDGLPWVHDFHAGSMRRSSMIAELRRIRAEHFDAVLLLPNSSRSGIFARLTGIAHRAGISRPQDFRGWLLTHRLANAQSLQDEVAKYAALASWWTGTPLINRTVELHTTESERTQAQQLLRDLPATRADGPCDLILLNPGANRLDKQWPAHSFAQAARKISLARAAGEAPRPIVVTGGPNERALCAEVAKQSGGIDLVARGINLGSLKAVLQRTALLITNDTGPRHIAAAFATPTIALFGPTDCRKTPMDYPNERRLIAEPFLPEDQIADDIARACAGLCAMDRICVGDVVHAAHALDASQSTHNSSRISA